MSDSLAVRLRSGDGRRAKVDGVTVYSYLRFAVSDGDRIEVQRVSSSPHRAQALKLAVDRGDLRANGVLTTTAAVWTHTAPETAVLTVAGKRAKSIDIWNAWSLAGVDSSWIGNAGMRVQSRSDVHMISCSDGVGPASFDDLRVRVTIIRST